MTQAVTTVRSDSSINEAIILMVARRLSGLPVVDAQDRLIGILTEGDLLRRVELGTSERGHMSWLERIFGADHGAEDYIRTHSRKVHDLMTPEVATVGEDASIEDVVALMGSRRVKRVPVVRDGRVVGIVSRADLVRLLGQSLQPHVSELPDSAIVARLQAELQEQRWVSARDVDFTVEQGVVTLQGVVSDERVRDALRVAAQNVPGVADVEDRLTIVDPVTAGLMF